MSNAVVIIPARFKSSRFPGKPLVILAGIPMIIRVANIAEKAVGRENVYIATDDVRIAEIAEQYCYKFIMTSKSCITGTDRVAEAAQHVKADIYVNVQGDEPMLNHLDIIKSIQEKAAYPSHVINFYCKLHLDDDPDSINIPKVVFDTSNNLIYMSRSAIPGVKDSTNGLPNYYKQVCIYSYNKKELEFFEAQKKKGNIERFEDIEILRFLEIGVPVKMILADTVSLAVDTPDDAAKVNMILEKLCHE